MAETDTEVLEELREQFIYGTTEWQDIRDAGDEDMRALAGDLWDPTERKEREDAGRPCLSLDELTQYVNQLNNEVRSSKRGIQVTPKGQGATDQTAQFRQGLMRQIEYESNAQQAAYIVMAENAFQRSYGFLRIKAEYVTDKSFEQRLVLDPLPDPDMVTIDPDIVRTDGKDMQWGFIREARSTKQFLREFPHAERRSFSDEFRKVAGKEWIVGDRLNIAEYWRVTPEQRRLLLLKPPPPTAAAPQPQPLSVFVDELEQLPSSEQILKDRWVTIPKVRQYFTNGVELLRPKGQVEAFTAWPGKSIPIVPCFGKVMYVKVDGQTKRVILSLIRLARDPAMLYCFYRTQQAEMAGMIPKVPVMGYKGQFRGVESDWERSPHEPIAFLEANALTEATGSQILPLPVRLAYEAGAHLQALELCAEGARRAIQAAIGISSLPTAAQRRNEKSAVALDKIDSQEQKGSFHFIDHYDEAITRTAQILEELVPFYYDTARDVTIRKPDDTPAVTRINDPSAEEHIPTDVGEHDVTLSTGPSFKDQREAASSFADSLAQNPQIFALIGDLLVKLKNLGPIGDEIADRLTPPQFRQQPGTEGIPPQAQAMLGQANQKIQELTQQASQMADVIKTEQVKAQAAKEIKQMDLAFQEKKLARDSETKITVAELAAKVDRLQLYLEERARIGMQISDAAAATADRAHDVGLAALSHAQTLEQGDQAHGQALEQLAAQPTPAPADDASA